MKKIFLTFIAFTLSVVAFAQNPFLTDCYRIKKVEANDGQESKEFFYDNDNVLTNDYWINYRNGNPDIQDSLFYDGSFNVNRRAKYQPSTGTNWYMVSYCDYTYNELGQRLTRKNYNYDVSGTYKLGGTITYSYDANGRLIHWDLEFPTMGPYQKCDYTYDANGNCILEMTYQYDSWYMAWVDAYKLEYSYDYADNLVEMKGYYPNNGGWIESSHKVWMFNQDGNVTFEYSYDGQNIIEQHEYEYDMDLLTINIIPRVNPEDEWPNLPKTRNAIIKDRYSSRQGGSLQYVCDYDYTYEEFIYDAISENSNSILNVYPNPAIDNLTIQSNDYQRVELIDASGKLVFSSEFENEITINTDDMSSGVYFVKLIGNENVKTEKVILK